MKRFPKLSPVPIWVGAAALLALLLSACGSLLDPAVDTGDRGENYELIASIAIDPTLSRDELESASGGSVIVYRPEAHFAIVAFEKGRGDLALMSNADPNQDMFGTPEVNANGWTAWSGGYTAWSGGWTAWSGGYTAWSGGAGTPTTFGENIVHWDQIDLPEAQDLAPQLGAGVKVAVIDTGIDLTHPAFSGKLAPASEWMDYVDNDNYPMDEAGGDGYGHGTGVAGVILQVAPNATILPLRVLDADGMGDVDSVVSAIDHAVQMGAQVINLSLGTPTDVAALRSMVQYAASQNVFVVSSAGNTGDENVTFPAAYSRGSGIATSPVHRLIGVGSVGVADSVSPFSTFGSDLEMVAPGENVYTLFPDERIAFWSGTSFAAPMVSGAMALSVSKYASGFVFKRLGHYLNESAVPLTNSLGNGRLDARALIQKANFAHDEY